MLKPPPLKSTIGADLLYESNACWAKENAPPQKSRRTFSRDHPTVDFRFQFKYTYGMYLTKVINALQYPSILIVEAFLSKLFGFAISYINITKTVRNSPTRSKITAILVFVCFPLSYIKHYEN